MSVWMEKKCALCNEYSFVTFNIQFYIQDELCTLFRNYGTVTSVRIMDGKTGGKYG